MNTSATPDDIMQIVRSHKDWHRDAGVAASALHVATDNYLRSGLLEDHIKRDLNIALHEELPRFDHRLTSEHLTAFHAFADHQSDRVAAAAVQAIDAVLTDVNVASTAYVRLLSRSQ